MDLAEIERRFAEFEARLKRLEALFSAPKPAAPAAQPASPVPVQAARPAAPKAPAARPESADRPSSATTLLGWGGAAALVLAASYLIRLAIENGWLTPMRQVALATI